MIAFNRTDSSILNVPTIKKKQLKYLFVLSLYSNFISSDFDLSNLRTIHRLTLDFRDHFISIID